MAQIFSNVSPQMHNEFEIEYAMRWYENFGLAYYGCCEPLDTKMEIVRKLPNIRKVSMSPWSNMERGAEAIGSDYVFSGKPTPACFSSWDPDAAKKDIRSILDACIKNSCPVEILMKDISTVKYKPENLWEWAEITRAQIE
jgi:hypothetical protein